jgi:hypothetical protein
MGYAVAQVVYWNRTLWWERTFSCVVKVWMPHRASENKQNLPNTVRWGPLVCFNVVSNLITWIIKQ